jgi:hypothetical protein
MVTKSLNFHSTIFFSSEKVSQAPVAHTCNPTYSGGRDQEDLFEASPDKRELFLKKPKSSKCEVLSSNIDVSGYSFQHWLQYLKIENRGLTLSKVLI